MPYANDVGSSWNDTKCTPIAPDPAAPGEPCTVVEHGVSGIDTCEKSAMCWHVDPHTKEGVCVAFCSGSEANPTCEEGFVCTLSGREFVPAPELVPGAGVRGPSRVEGRGDGGPPRAWGECCGSGVLGIDSSRFGTTGGEHALASAYCAALAMPRDASW